MVKTARRLVHLVTGIRIGAVAVTVGGFLTPAQEGGGALAAQQPAEGVVACRSCRVRSVALRVVGDTTGAGEMPAEVRTVLVDERGTVIVSGYKPEPPVAYLATGEFHARLGSIGAGPGEVSYPLVIGARRDSVWILDGINARVSVFSLSKTPSFLGSWRTPAASGLLSAAVLSDGTVIANAIVPTREAVGIPLHRLLTDGRRLPINPGTPVTYTTAAPKTAIRALAPTNAGFWAAHVDRYLLERFDSAGNLLRRVERRVPWFVPGDGRLHPPSPDQPPVPRVAALQASGDDRLWVVIQVADSGYTRGLRERAIRRSYRQGRWEIADFDRFYDTVVEVWDVPSGQVLASARFDEAMSFVPTAARDSALAAGLVMTPTGHQRVRLFRLRLTGGR